MKRVIITLIALCIALSANAQFYVGGGFKFSSNADAELTTFSFSPEFGYNLNDSFAVGLAFGSSFRRVNDYSSSTISFKPYVRYTFAELGIVRLFVDGAVALSKTKNADGAWEIGAYPGIAIPVGERLSFVAHMGQLSFNSSSVFTLGLDNTVSAGLFFHF